MRATACYVPIPSWLSTSSQLTGVMCLVVIFALSGCVAIVPSGVLGGAPQPTLFSAHSTADYQLGGSYPPPAGATVVTRDSMEKPAPGSYSICYVNGFQTQPGIEWPDALVIHKNGVPLVDPNWPDEHIIDIGTSAKRADAAAIQSLTIDRCATAGFAAVEFDNVDSYTRSDTQLTLSDAIAFAKLLVSEAHRQGLAAGQKNTPQLGTRGRDDIGFNFAVAEECDQFNECPAYTAIYGAHVIDIEYTDALRRPFAQVCADPATPASTILRDRHLQPLGGPEYFYAHC